MRETRWREGNLRCPTYGRHHVIAFFPKTLPVLWWCDRPLYTQHMKAKELQTLSSSYAAHVEQQYTICHTREGSNVMSDSTRRHEWPPFLGGVPALSFRNFEFCKFHSEVQLK